MSLLPPSVGELRHQIAAVIDPSLAVSVEPKTAADIAAAAAYVVQRKSTKVTGAGTFIDGAALPLDNLFFNWVNAGGLVVPSATLPDFLIAITRQFLNQTGTNQKGG